jgi:hypothetical protein
LSPKTFPYFGLVLQLAASAGAHVAFVAEGSLYDNRWDTVGVSTLGNHVSALVLGARLGTGLFHLKSGSDEEGIRAFAQLLVGPEASAVVPTRFAIQPAAGIDVRLSPPGLWFRGSVLAALVVALPRPPG